MTLLLLAAAAAGGEPLRLLLDTEPQRPGEAAGLRLPRVLAAYPRAFELVAESRPKSSVRCVSILGFSTMTCPSGRGRETRERSEFSKPFQFLDPTAGEGT